MYKAVCIRCSEFDDWSWSPWLFEQCSLHLTMLSAAKIKSKLLYYHGISFNLYNFIWALVVTPTKEHWIILLFNIFEILNKIEKSSVTVSNAQYHADVNIRLLGTVSKYQTKVLKLEPQTSSFTELANIEFIKIENLLVTTTWKNRTF